MSLLSALIPALEASRVAPAEAMRREARQHETLLHVRRYLAFAALLSQSAGLLCIPGFGYAATLFAIAATAMLSPAFVTGMIRICQRPLRRIAGAAGLIAGRSLVASLARTSIVVTALATAISMMVSVGIMVGSFRETVEVWLESSLQADIYLRAAGPATAGIYPPLDPAVAETVRATPGVGDLDVFHAFTFSYEGVRATFGAGIRRSLRFVAGAFPKAGQAVVSEPFATKHHVHVGDVLHIPLGSATAELRVAGIYYDYANDQGFVLVDQSTLLHYLPHQPATNIAIYVKPGADAVKVLHEIEARLAVLPVMIAPNEVLRRGAVEVFDRTFAVTYALEAVAIIVAMLGAANSLLALVLDRRREIGLIRYLGADRGQVRSMILTEAGLLGLLAGFLGLGLGWVLSLVLIFVVNKQSFGWTIQFHPPLLLLGGALLLVWTVTVLAGVYPARFASRLEPAEVVHEE